MLTQRNPSPYLIFHAPNMGSIARYHLDQPAIDQVICDLHQGGAGGICLSPWLMQNAAALGTGDQYLDWKDGSLTPQNQQNLKELLVSIRDRFHWVLVAPQFYNENDPRQWAAFDEALYQQNKEFLFWLVDILNQADIPWMLDACTEVNDVINPVLMAYAKRLWVDLTGWFYPGGVPPWNLSMSFVPGNWELLREVFQGNNPPILLPHLYADTSGNLKTALEDAHINLQTEGLVQPWIIAETDTLQLPAVIPGYVNGDTQPPKDLAAFIQETEQAIIGVCPWPIGVPWKPGDPSVTVVPPPAPTLWTPS